MTDKEEIEEKIREAEAEAKKIADEIAAAEATAMHRLCRYRNCGKDFATDDDRRHYCCPEHYKAENRERSESKNEARRQGKNKS